MTAAALAVNALLPCRVMAMDGWRSIVTAHFTVRYRQGMEDLGVLAATQAEDAYLLIADYLSHDIRHAITVTVWPVRSGPCPDGEATCLSMARRPGSIDVMYPGSPGGFRRSLAQTLTGAIVHDILGGGSPPVPALRALSMPGWFYRALTEYCAYYRKGATPAVSRGMQARHCPGLFSLTGSPAFPLPADPLRGADFISYMEATYGWPSTGEIIRDIRDTGSFEKAVRIATGRTPRETDADLSSYISRVRRAGLSLQLENDPPGDRNDAFRISPAVSPDGTRIAYLTAGRGPVSLSVAQLTRGREGALVVGPGRALRTGSARLWAGENRLSWTADGKSIVLAGRRGGNEALLWIDAETGSVISEERMPFYGVMRPFLSRDGSRIAFSGIASSSTDIYLYDRKAGRIIRLTDDPFTDRDPSLTPDCSAVIFATNSNDAGDIMKESYDIVRQDIRTGSRTVLVRNGALNIQPVLSPEGTRILFASSQGGGTGIYACDSEGRSVRRIGDTTRICIYPEWHPAGSGMTWVSPAASGSEINCGEFPALLP